MAPSNARDLIYIFNACQTLPKCDETLCFPWFDKASPWKRIGMTRDLHRILHVHIGRHMAAKQSNEFKTSLLTYDQHTNI